MYKISLVLSALLLFGGCKEQQEEKIAHTSQPTIQSAHKESIPTLQQLQAKEQNKVDSVPTTTAPTPTTKVIEPKKETKTEVLKTKTPPPQKAHIDASKLFVGCAGCHGSKGEKKALGKSDLIGGWEKAKVIEALKGYKSGNRNLYGMGGIMKGQAGKLSDEQIEALGEYISKLH